MEKERRKKLALVLGSLFVAVIFLSSYASFGGGGSTTTTTTTKPPTPFAAGEAVARVTGYGSRAYVTLADNASASTLNSTLSKLEDNGSISNFLFVGGGYQIVLSEIDAYSLQQLIRNTPEGGPLALANVTATAYLMLPANGVLYVGGMPVNVKFAKRNYSISLTDLRPIGANLSVSISALVTANGSIYNDQIRINYTS